jgi:glycosyltransferase involved in cell wall biosynthesis
LRVLAVLPFLPEPEGGAAQRCAVALLRGLAAAGVEQQVLCAVRRGIPLDAIPADLPVEAMELDPPSARRARWDRWFDPQGILRRGPFVDRVAEVSRGFDVVHFVDTHPGLLVGAVDRPAVVQIDRSTLADQDVWHLWRAEDREALVLWRGERRVCRRARWLLTNSEEVAARLRRSAPRAQVAVAPLALDPGLYEPPANLRSPAVGLIGTAAWPPTANAVRRLVTRVWPRVRAEEPGATLHLAGRGMERERFAALGEAEGVTWRGFVPSAADFIRELGVMCYPVSRGSGTKVKVLEAQALGLPVVTTREGAEGLAPSDGVVVETDDEALAAATVRLLRDPAARDAAGAAGRAAFESDHTPVPAAAPVIALYERMLR